MAYQWNELTKPQRVILRGFGGEQGIFVRPSVVRSLGGDGNAAILLHHLIFWSQSDMAEERDGWFFVTTQRLMKETGLSYDVQARVRTKLVALGVLEQERRGVPAKNYYRVNLTALVDLLEEDENKIMAITSSRKGDSPDLDTGNAKNYIVKDRVKDSVKLSNSAAPKNATNNVLGEKLESFVAWVVGTYPTNANGIGATEGMARKAAERIGGYQDKNKPDFIARKRKDMEMFILGMKNLAAAANEPSFDRKFVPGFANFAGIGVMYGKEAGFIAWAARKAPAPQRERLVV